MLRLDSKKLFLSPTSNYDIDTILFESLTAGTYSLDILDSGKYEVYCIAGGGGGRWYKITSKMKYNNSGGSGSGFIGNLSINKGLYTIIVGAGAAGDGGNSSISNIITTYGGKGGSTSQAAPGAGGAIPSITTTIISSSLNSAGNTGRTGSSNTSYSGGASLYNGYGAGGGFTNGASKTLPGTVGYIKIVYKGK